MVTETNSPRIATCFPFEEPLPAELEFALVEYLPTTAISACARTCHAGRALMSRKDVTDLVTKRLSQKNLRFFSFKTLTNRVDLLPHCLARTAEGGLAVGTCNGELLIYDLKKGTERILQLGHMRRIDTLTPLSATRIAARDINSDVTICDVNGGEPPRFLTNLGRIDALRDGRLIAIHANQQNIIVTNPETQEVKCMQRRGIIEQLEVLSKERFAIGYRAEQTGPMMIQTFDVEHGKRSSTVYPAASCFAALPCGKLAVGFESAETGKGGIAIWDPATGDESRLNASLSSPPEYILPLAGGRIACINVLAGESMWFCTTYETYIGVYSLNPGEKSFVCTQNSTRTAYETSGITIQELSPEELVILDPNQNHFTIWRYRDNHKINIAAFHINPTGKLRAKQAQVQCLGSRRLAIVDRDHSTLTVCDFNATDTAALQSIAAYLETEKDAQIETARSVLKGLPDKLKAAIAKAAEVEVKVLETLEPKQLAAAIRRHLG